MIRTNRLSRLLHSSSHPLNQNAFYLFKKNWNYNRKLLANKINIIISYVIDSYVENFIKYYYRHDEITRTIYRLIYNIQNSDQYLCSVFFSSLFFLDREQTNGNTADTYVLILTRYIYWDKRFFRTIYNQDNSWKIIHLIDHFYNTIIFRIVRITFD